MNWAQFWITILGGMQVEVFFAYAVMMGLGAFVDFALDVRHSVRTDPKTPKKFSFRFVIVDNLLRFLAVIVFIAILVLYFEDWFDTPLNGKVAFVFGMGLDVFIGKLLSEGKNVPMIKKSRNKMIEKINGS